MNKENVEKKAEEKVTLSRGEVWMLRIAAATGIMSFISHGIQFVGQLLNWL